MEPIIEFESQTQIAFIDYRKHLADKIKSVCSAIGFSYRGIKWIIFEPEFYKMPELQRILVGTKGKDYGYTNGRDTIWISTLAITKDVSKNSALRVMNSVRSPLNINRKNDDPDFLADVILDEIAHVATKRGHGDPLYEQTLNSYRDRYYNGPFSIARIFQ